MRPPRPDLAIGIGIGSATATGAAVGRALMAGRMAAPIKKIVESREVEVIVKNCIVARRFVYGQSVES